MKKQRTMNKSLIATLVALAGVAAATHYLTRMTMDEPRVGHSEGEKKPLYWVAPMDPSYRRDKPGKSPMGMDLVPVYAQDTGPDADSPGTILISPRVVNNLGVRTAIAERRPMETKITTVGYVQYDRDHLVHIHPRVEGWVEKLYVKEAGDSVEKGQPLYSLYSPLLVNAQEELLLAVNRKDARLMKAAEERLAALQVDKSVIDELERSRAVSRRVIFHAPQSGLVGRLHIREGSFVRPDTTLMSLAKLDDVWVQAEVFESQAALVQVGLPVTMTSDYLPRRRWQGKVDHLYPTLDSETRTVRLRLRFNNPDALLKPGMFTQVVIQASDEDEVLAVPKEAVIRLGDHNRVVLALGEGRFRSVAVELGRLDADYAEIRSGLAAGERVVTSAQFLLDSESAKTSDLMRMDHTDRDPGAMDPPQMNHRHSGHGSPDGGAR